jgi:hypothetical protein
MLGAEKEAVMAEINTSDVPLMKLLERAEKEYQLVDQWMRHKSPEWLGNALEHSAKALALVEFVEAHFCGSVGGFAPGQINEQRRDLPARLAFLRKQLKIKASTQRYMVDLPRAGKHSPWRVLDEVMQIEVFHWHGDTGEAKCRAVSAALNSLGHEKD